jgi:hypothetical protein
LPGALTLYTGNVANLSEWRQQRAFAVRLVHLVRAEKRELAAELILAEAAALSGELAIPDAQDVQIGGWDMLVAGVVGAADDLAATGKRLAVTSIELVNRRYLGSRDGRFPETDTVRLEARFHHEPPDQRTRDCPRRMLNRTRYENSRWREYGLGPVCLSLDGVQELAAFQRGLGPSTTSSDIDRERAIFLAGWLMWLRVEAAVAWDVVRRGLPYPMPVIFGVNHVSRPMESNELDYGPRAESLQFATEKALARGEHERLLEAKRAAEA